MATPDVSPGGTKRRISLTGAVKRRADRSGLAQALGATAVTPMPNRSETPLGFVAVRQKLMTDRRSIGGRPGFADAERRKIPIPAMVWQLVSDVAAEMAEPGFHPSAAQVASAILSVAVDRMSTELREDARRALKATE